MYRVVTQKGFQIKILMWDFLFGDHNQQGTEVYSWLGVQGSHLEVLKYWRQTQDSCMQTKPVLQPF